MQKEVDTSEITTKKKDQNLCKGVDWFLAIDGCLS